MFSGQPKYEQIIHTAQTHIDYYYTEVLESKELTLESEYRYLTGQEYEADRKEYGKVINNSDRFRQTDFKVAQSFYAYGRDKQEVIRTIMQQSPAVKTMSKAGQELYKKKLRSQMNAVEPKRKKIQQQKQTYGIQSDCKRSTQNYLRCIKAEQKARKQGMMITHLSYRKFQKQPSANYHKTYIADIERKIAQQRKLEREQQQKKEQQMQRQRERGM